ncbi:hypothetical protein SAMN02745664_11822 [Moraxella cuniculi DSM 21768]|uniref:DUF697 domain-containing protein n=2 Tax=Moraxella cuniculi TaxID=34061 RepID=A0A1N7FWB8_9GAMM|nr:hypothetical protein [Moraxella cuniculi]OOS03665.1 hypothetical protein B0189_09115 [Moraxella cuniculi]SIS04663.1 hypothetical protein SAMN02745664_11822 [Moraxella cuniculi DSM 21768]VEG13921.1 Uncharacterized protein/domain associated with GTPases [Moraxella cuniculi]
MLNTSISQPVATNIDTTLNLEQIRAECQALAKSRAKISAGVAVIPLPFLDVAVDVAMLSKLLPEITARFGLKDEAQLAGNETLREQNLKDRIIAVGGLIAARGVVNKTVQGFGGRFIGKQVSKYIPLGGSMVAATLGYMIFKKISFDHIEECYAIAKKAQREALAATQ